MYRKKTSKIFLIIVGVFIVLVFIQFMMFNKYNIYVTVQNPKLNEMMQINIEVKKGKKYVEVETLNINMMHKYKKDETFETTLSPYAKGRYEFNYYPQIQGEYYLEIAAKLNDGDIYKNISIEVE